MITVIKITVIICVNIVNIAYVSVIERKRILSEIDRIENDNNFNIVYVSVFTRNRI